MVTEQSWSSFHQKFGSESSRRSSRIKDSGDKSDGRVSGAVRTLLRKCSSRKSMGLVPDEFLQKPISRTLPSSDSSIRSSRNLMSPDEIKSRSLSSSESVHSSYSSIFSSRNLIVQDEIKRKHLSRSRSLYASDSCIRSSRDLMAPEEIKRKHLSRSRSLYASYSCIRSSRDFMVPEKRPLISRSRSSSHSSIDQVLGEKTITNLSKSCHSFTPIQCNITSRTA